MTHQGFHLNNSHDILSNVGKQTLSLLRIEFRQPDPSEIVMRG